MSSKEKFTKEDKDNKILGVIGQTIFRFSILYFMTSIYHENNEPTIFNGIVIFFTIASIFWMLISDLVKNDI